jgi:hypothetical protein
MKISSPFKIYLFIVINLITIFYHIFAINESSSKRDLLYEPDDSFHEIIKANNLLNCSKKNCLGLNNINTQNQNLKKFNFKENKIGNEIIHQTILEYHPLKSYLILSFNKLFNNWEKSFTYSSYLQTILLVFSMNFGILLLFGINSGLIGAMIFLPFVGIKYGYHFSLGSDELSCFFSILLICLTNINFRYRYLLYPILGVCAYLSHPIGIISICIIFTYVLFTKKIINKSYDLISLVITASSCLVISVYTDFNYANTPHNIASIYNVVDAFNLESLKFIFLKNLKENIYILYEINSLISLLVFPVLIYFYINNYKLINENKNFVPLVFIIFAIFIGSLINPQPYVSTLIRLQNFTLFLIVGTCAHIISVLLIGLNNNTHGINNRNYIFLIFIFFIYLFTSFNNFTHLKQMIKSNQETLHQTYDDHFIENFYKNELKENPLIFYGSNSDFSSYRTLIFKYLINGGYNKNIYLYELFENKKKLSSLAEFYDAIYMAVPSPIIINNKYKKDYKCFNGIRMLYNCIKVAWYGGSRINNSDLLIRNKDKIKILTDSDSISIFINTFNDKINIVNEDSAIELNTSNKFEWVEISNFKSKNLLFELNKNSFIKILGIKTKESKDNYWSWDDDYEIEVQRGENIFRYTINKNLFPTIDKCFFSNIVNDFGSSVVLKFKC